MISNGLMKIGIQYINQSIESYLYCISRHSIFSNRGSTLETQRFRKLVKDSILNYDTSTSIDNIN